jgi:hypothetical protein
MPTHPAEMGAIGAKLRGASAAWAIADLAERQHGLVARRQLVDLGISQRAIGRRIADRELRRVHRGVYTTGHAALSADARAMAGVLLGGDRATLCIRSAGQSWGMLRSAPTRIDVWVPAERRPARAVRFHYGRIEPDEITTLRGIPITGVSRTIFDLARTESPQRVAAAMKQAEVLRLTDDLSLPMLLERYPRRAGAALLRSLVGATLPLTRSELELAFLARVGLPLPETNVWLRIGDRWIEADCVWREQKVIAELDGHSAHGTRTAFETDRVRDRRLSVRGWRPIRITWRAIHDEPCELEQDLRVLLAA